jgi:hypothetical protein
MGGLVGPLNLAGIAPKLQGQEKFASQEKFARRKNSASGAVWGGQGQKIGSGKSLAGRQLEKCRSLSKGGA